MSAMYANHCPTNRLLLWDHLSHLSKSISGPWLLVDIPLPCKLMDLGFKGPKFTWRRNTRNNIKVAKMLDRALANNS